MADNEIRIEQLSGIHLFMLHQEWGQFLSKSGIEKIVAGSNRMLNMSCNIGRGTIFLSHCSGPEQSKNVFTKDGFWLEEVFGFRGPWRNTEGKADWISMERSALALRISQIPAVDINRAYGLLRTREDADYTQLVPAIHKVWKQIVGIKD